MYSIGYNGNWWSSTEYDSESAYYWYLDHVAANYDITTDFGYSDREKGNGYSIRCIRE